MKSVAFLYLGAVFNNTSLTINELRAILLKSPADISAELKDVAQADFKDMLIANKDKFIGILDKIASFGYGNVSLSNLPLDCIAGKHNNIISDCNINGDFTMIQFLLKMFIVLIILVLQILQMLHLLQLIQHIQIIQTIQIIHQLQMIRLIRRIIAVSILYHKNLHLHHIKKNTMSSIKNTLPGRT